MALNYFPLAILLSLALSSLAIQVPQDERTYAGKLRSIFLHNKEIVTTNSLEFHEDNELAKLHSNFKGAHHQFLIQLRGPITDQIKNRIKAVLGDKGRLGDYIPHNSFLFTTNNRDKLFELQELDETLWIGGLQSEDKIQSQIFEDAENKNSEVYDLEMDLKIILHSGHHHEAISKLSVAWKSSLIFEFHKANLKRTAIGVFSKIQIIVPSQGSTSDIVVIKGLPNSEARKFVAVVLSKQPEVQFIEAKTIHRFNAGRASGIVLTGTPGQSATGALASITGSGVNIALGDTGIFKSSCFFSGTTVTGLTSSISDSDGHGTAVASAAVGNSGTHPNATGVAPGASLLVYDFGESEVYTKGNINIDNYLSLAKSKDAHIVGFTLLSSDTTYTTDSKSIDDFAYSNQNILPVVAAGNTGNSKGQQSVFYSINAPANAKNALTVGASQSDYMDLLDNSETVNNTLIGNSVLYGKNVLASFSSRGPTSDGRIKPDVVAPGHFPAVASSSSDCAVTNSLYGTSIAAGYAAGAAAIAKSYLSTVATTVDAALIKAFLINSGVPLYGVDTTQLSLKTAPATFVTLSPNLPDNYQGFGRINLQKGADTFILSLSGSIASLAYSTRQCFTVSSSENSVKITLVWTDPGASVLSGLSLVNNLDLLLVASDGTIFKGNAKISTDFDVLNNVEHISLTGLSIGEYGVLVYGQNVPSSSQSFSLVVSGTNITKSTSCSALPCPNLCGNSTLCNTDGTCNCGTSYGADCSLRACSSKDCSANGLCNFQTLTCQCFSGFFGADCSSVLQTVFVQQDDTGVKTGIAVGVWIGCFFIGAIPALILGWFGAIKYLEKLRKEKRREMIGSSSGGENRRF